MNMKMNIIRVEMTLQIMVMVVFLTESKLDVNVGM